MHRPVGRGPDFNEPSGEPGRPIYGCVTTGDDWQFFRLDGADVTLDRSRYDLDNPEKILAILRLGIETKKVPT